MSKADLESYIEATICDIKDFERVLENEDINKKDIKIFLNNLKERFKEMEREKCYGVRRNFQFKKTEIL